MLHILDMVVFWLHSLVLYLMFEYCVDALTGFAVGLAHFPEKLLMLLD
jgi:hypothetical protein